MIDASIPFRAGTAGQFSLADLAQQSQQLRHGEQAMQQRERALNQQDQQFQAQQQERETARQREQAGMVARLTANVRDEGSYQQARRAAEAYGIDVAGSPANYDPDWVQTQHIIADTFFREGPDKLTTTAQELREAGLEPGTPEFQRAMAQRISMKDSKVVNTTAGGMSGMLGPNGYQPFILPNPGGEQAGAPASGGAPAQVQSEADYNALPPGTEYIDPQGNRRTKGGGASNGAGNFQP